MVASRSALPEAAYSDSARLVNLTQLRRMSGTTVGSPTRMGCIGSKESARSGRARMPGPNINLRIRPLKSNVRFLWPRYNLLENVDRVRAERGRALPHWPSWCFLPLGGAWVAVGGRQENITSERLEPSQPWQLWRAGGRHKAFTDSTTPCGTRSGMLRWHRFGVTLSTPTLRLRMRASTQCRKCEPLQLNKLEILSGNRR